MLTEDVAEQIIETEAVAAIEATGENIVQEVNDTVAGNAYSERSTAGKQVGPTGRTPHSGDGGSPEGMIAHQVMKSCTSG